MTPPDPASLTPSQQAAAAKVACGCSRPGGVVVLCGPQGVGNRVGNDGVEAVHRRGVEAKFADVAQRGVQRAGRTVRSSTEVDPKVAIE